MMTTVSVRLRQKKITSFAAVVVLLGLCPWVNAQVVEGVPDALKEVGVVEHFDAQVPLDAEFKDSNGKTVTLGQYINGERPVILTLNYYKCPMLCGLQLNGFLQGLKELNWTAGEEFEIVTVSINALETPALALDKKTNYMKQYERAGAGAGWHFLTGGEPAIKAVAEAVGFGFVYDPKTAQYAHAAALMVLTPNGRVARYLYGIEYPAKELRFALMEARAEQIGSPLDRILLYCYHYDSTNRRYTPVAMNIMRLGGGTTALILGSSLGLMWLRDFRRRKKSHRGMSDT